MEDKTKTNYVLLSVVIVCLTSIILTFIYMNSLKDATVKETDPATTTSINSTTEESTKAEKTIKTTEVTPTKRAEKTTKPTTTKKTENYNKTTTNKSTTKPKDNTSKTVSLGTFKLTAYCNCSKCCGKWAGGATASGTMPKAGRTIAVDTRVIPFGTKVKINGKTYMAEDTGSAIKGNRIDIYMDSHQAALNFGAQYAEVFKVS